MNAMPEIGAALAGAALKGALLLGLAALAALTLRHSSAAARHAVWWAALAGLLMLPVLEALLPAWEAPGLSRALPAAES
ncbi:MAG: hypothetical protein ACRELC_11115, partial [Gemmatimonadota bacterium]